MHQIGLALALDQGIQHAFDRGERQVAAMHVFRIRKADRAGEVAGGVDLDDRQAAMLFVIGAEAAIERAARLGPCLSVKRPVAGLEPQFLRTPIIEIVADQRLLHAMHEAALQIIDGLILDDDLGWHRLQAGLAQARRLPVENVGRRLALRRYLGGGLRERSR